MILPVPEGPPEHLPRRPLLAGLLSDDALIDQARQEFDRSLVDRPESFCWVFRQPFSWRGEIQSVEVPPLGSRDVVDDICGLGIAATLKRMNETDECLLQQRSRLGGFRSCYRPKVVFEQRIDDVAAGSKLRLMRGDGLPCRLCRRC